MSKKLLEFAKQIARELRKNMTEAERILWEELRDRKLLGKKFLRQHPLLCLNEGRPTFFIADFYCYERKLVVELDGRIHERQKEHDELRTHLINNKGIRVVRFKNEEVERRLTDVLKQLEKYLSE
ncbi:MAG: endonuclease domain-containing protein [Ignavibacteriae bacterium]|nr:endonuclease domain-containing protein [Ignavibacteriota bacterium]